MRTLTDRDWQTVYNSTDQTIEQRVVDGIVEERVTWHRDTPERLIADLSEKVADLNDQATGKITKAQLTARLDAAKDTSVKPGKG